MIKIAYNETHGELVFYYGDKEVKITGFINAIDTETGELIHAAAPDFKKIVELVNLLTGGI